MMECRSLSLAGVTVCVSSPDLARFFDACGGFGCFCASDATPHWEVRYGQPVAPWNDATLLSEFHFLENQSRCCFLRSGDSYQFAMYSDVGNRLLVCLQYRRGASVVDISSCDDVPAWRFSLWFACSLLGLQADATFVHSSAVVWQGQAVLFLGESGTGKSTHARLWLQTIEGCQLLNDDSPFLRLVDGVPIVYGSPWSGKSPVFSPRHFPLKAVVRLSQASHNAIRRLSVVESFGALQPSLPPALMQDDGIRTADSGSGMNAADLLIEMISQTLTAVPVYHLQCLPDDDAARLCFATLFGTSQTPMHCARKEMF